MKKAIFILILLGSNMLYSQMPNTISKADKVYGLSKFWQEVNYNFVYLNTIDREKWEADYKKLITDVQNTKDDYEYYMLLRKFCASLKDGHTNVNFPKEIGGSLFNTYFGEYRLFLTPVDGKSIVNRVNLSKKDEIPIGSEIIEINGMPTQEYKDEFVKPYISSSTDYVLEDMATYLLFRAPKGTSFDIKLKFPNGTINDYHLTHTETTEKEVYPPFENHQLLDFKWLENDMAYIALNSFGDEKIDSIFLTKLPELYKAKSLIIDLRNNGGGSTEIGSKILQYFVNDTILFGSRSFSRLHIPAYKAWGKWVEAKDTTDSEWAKKSYLSFRDSRFYEFEYDGDTTETTGKRIIIPTTILLGHNTASAAEDFLIYADGQKHMTKIGERSFGSTGQPMLFEMPGGGSARVCTKKDTYPDGREFVGYGVKPDIYVKKTVSDYIEDKDPVLEKAIEFLNKK